MGDERSRFGRLKRPWASGLLGFVRGRPSWFLLALGAFLGFCQEGIGPSQTTSDLHAQFANPSPVDGLPRTLPSPDLILWERPLAPARYCYEVGELGAVTRVFTCTKTHGDPSAETKKSPLGPDDVPRPNLKGGEAPSSGHAG